MSEQKWRAYEEKTVRTEPIYKGKFISFEVEHVMLPNGTLATREVVRHPGAVAVLALHEGRMLVVEQYRKPLERSLVEIPAGKLEPDEDPMEAAMRELKEETGFTAKRLVPIVSFYTSPGFADEIMHLYFAEEVVPGEASPDQDEFLSCSALTLEEARRAVASGAIRDAKTVTAICAWERYVLTGKIGWTD